MKLFFRYVDDIVRTVKGVPCCGLDAASTVHPNLHFTLEITNSKGNLPFLDLNINVLRFTVIGIKNQHIQRLY